MKFHSFFKYGIHVEFYVNSEEKWFSGKLSKPRITVIVASHMTETIKRKLLVIGSPKIHVVSKKSKVYPWYGVLNL